VTDHSPWCFRDSSQNNTSVLDKVVSDFVLFFNFDDFILSFR